VSKSQPSWPRVILFQKDKDPPTPPDSDLSYIREKLQSTALLVEREEYGSPNEAFSGAGNKVIACFEILADYLAAYQRNAPYLVSWQIYPISRFDVGAVYHTVDHFCPKAGHRELVASALTFTLPAS